MARYGMVIDITKCTGCYNCFLACRDEFAGNEYAGYSAAQPMTGQNWIHLIERERGQYPKVKVAYTPIICQHCENATCVKMAPNNAVYRRPDGIVIIDPVKAKGHKEIIGTCPYRVIEWNEEAQVPQKCTFCAHMLDKGEKEPRCVEACPTGALVFGDLDDSESAVAKAMSSEEAEVLHPEFGMKERVKYLDLPRKFVAGTVIYGDVDECAAGVTVTLGPIENMVDRRENVSLAEQPAIKFLRKYPDGSTKTNAFGDFEFEGLPDNASFTVKVEAPGYKPVSKRAKTQKDIYLGEIVLKK
jgi:Fe-S-cluster-containing dehydrogenase component